MNLAERLQNVMKRQKRRILGLMSGMSMDGVDLADVICTGVFPNISVEFLGNHYVPYSSELKTKLLSARFGSVAEISELNFVVAETFASCVSGYFEKTGTCAKDFDAIGSHGQTVFHSTATKFEGETRSRHGSTLQLGPPSLIAEFTGLPTVANFRVRDVAVGGQGAPFVPLAEFLLNDKSEPLLLVNFGSIANVTLLDPNSVEIFACDFGPANLLVDFLARRQLGVGAFDQDGDFSARGNVIATFLEELLALPYFKIAPPKAAGYSEFGEEKITSFLSRYQNCSTEDLLRTAVEFSAVTFADGVKAYVLTRCPKLKRVRVSGGGIYNKTLCKRVKELLPQLAFESLTGIEADAREAVAFAILAHVTLNGDTGNLPSATGARRAVVLGEIAP